MEVKAQMEISDAEWEVMRVIWTLGSATSHTVIEALSEKMGWKAATTKTLLGRLMKKGALTAKKNGRAFTYFPEIPEQEAMDVATISLFDHLCQMRAGATLTALADHVSLSQTDIANLQKLLTEKAKTAPEKVSCNCLPDDCHCQ
ncbi:CopY/TcrY family copper transport repressor [Loigolactobacillus iwatensis]|uniref:CopY/TcrY family copper transport repressor n=1 Tax=Loigolactobacillus iwatensis TaxID=1267156 RepID=UPI000F7E67EE|nr:CopY/TcrY family copper transport repressor [Loigolactobacillus iwatensis]